MEHYTDLSAFELSEAGDMMDTAGEVQDNRFAVVSECLYDLTSYNDCANESSYDVLTISRAEGMHNPSCMQGYPAGDPIEVYVWKDDETGAARRKMLQLMDAAMCCY